MMVFKTSVKRRLYFLIISKEKTNGKFGYKLFYKWQRIFAENIWLWFDKYVLKMLFDEKANVADVNIPYQPKTCNNNCHALMMITIIIDKAGNVCVNEYMYML